MQARRVSDHLAGQFQDLLSSGFSDIDSLRHLPEQGFELDARQQAEFLLTASLAFTRAEETARIARELCPVAQYSSWTARQNRAHEHLAQATRRLLALTSEPVATL
jgi:hypothetical protein